MKTRNILTLNLSALAVATAALAPTAMLADNPQSSQSTRPANAAKSAVSKAGTVVPNSLGVYVPNDPDMAARSIDFQVASRTMHGAGRVQIRGTAVNLGRRAYVTTAHPELQLKEDGRIVARAQFGNVAPGQSVEVKYELAWTLGHGKGHAFQLVVAYDPNDWGTDGNYGNNQISRSATDIDLLLR